MTTGSKNHGREPSYSEFEFKLNKERLAAYAGWEVEGLHLRRHPDKKAILDEAEKLINNPDLLIERVTKDPSVMDTGSGVVVALNLLRAYADAPKCESSTQAANILRAVGRRDLLPRTPNGKPETDKTRNPWLWFWQGEPEDLLDTVNDYRKELLRLFEDCPKNREHPRKPPRGTLKPKGAEYAYDCCITHAFRSRTGREPSKGDLVLIRGARDITEASLLFISYERIIPSDSLRKLYRTAIKGGAVNPRWGASQTEILQQKRDERLQEESQLEFFPLDSSESQEKK